MKKIATTTAQSQGLDPIDGATTPENLFAPTASANPENVKELVIENKGVRPGEFVKFRGEVMDASIIVYNNSQKLVVAMRSNTGEVSLITYDRNTFKETSLQLSAGLFENIVSLAPKIKKL